MKKQDLLQVYAYARSLWSSFKVPKGEVDARLHDEVWYEMLKPYDLDYIFLALKEYAKMADFCNIAKVGELCKKFTQMKEGTYIDEEIVVQNIYKAMLGNCDETFKKLSDFEQKIVESPAYLRQWVLSGQLGTVGLSNLRKRVHHFLEYENTKEALSQITISQQPQYLLDNNYQDIEDIEL